jgi:hypothetical protein
LKKNSKSFQTKSMGTMRKPSKSTQLIRKASWSVFIKKFNEKHNSHLNTSIGVVSVETKNNCK